MPRYSEGGPESLLRSLPALKSITFDGRGQQEINVASLPPGRLVKGVVTQHDLARRRGTLARGVSTRTSQRQGGAIAAANPAASFVTGMFG